MVGSIANFDISANKLRMTLKKDSPWAIDTKASFNDPHVNDLSGTSIAKGKECLLALLTYSTANNSCGLLTSMCRRPNW
jgi:hypothetical protein